MRILFLYRNAESLAIEYLSAIIKKKKSEVMLLFDPGSGDVEYPTFNFIKAFSEKTIDSAILYFKPDLILFSLLTNLLPWVTKWASYIKSKFDIPIGIGGVYPTIYPEYIIEKKFVDFICIGEGEHTIEMIIDEFSEKLQLKNVPNIWYKVKNKEGNITIVKNFIKPLISDLNSLPFPDKDIFYEYGVFSERYYIITGRGCPNSCSYCVNHQLKKIFRELGPNLRRRSPENVVNELLWAFKRYKYKEVYFYDDIFSLDIEWLKKFKALLKKNNLKLKYKCLVHPNFINVEIAKLLRETGCIDADIGIESGSEFIRTKVFQRNMSNQKIVKSVNILKSVGIRVSTLNILGNPFEEFKDIMDTVRLNLTLAPSGILLNTLYPFPKTSVYGLCEENNMIDEKTAKLIHEGYSSFRQESIIHHKYKDLITRLQIIVPILNKFPKKFWKILIHLPPNKLMRIFSIPFLTSFHNAKLKIKEFCFMMIKSVKHLCQIEKFNIDLKD